MNCPQCQKSMVLRQATKFGDEYYYCRNCKCELGEMPGQFVELLPRGKMNLEVSATTSSKVIEKIRQRFKGEIVFLLDSFEVSTASRDDLDRLASDFDNGRAKS